MNKKTKMILLALGCVIFIGLVILISKSQYEETKAAKEAEEKKQ